MSPDRIVGARLPFAPDLPALSAAPGLVRPALITVRGWQLLVADPVASLDSLQALSRYADRVGWGSPPPEGPPFRTAAVGYCTDDLSAELLHLPPDDRPAVASLPRVSFGVYEWAVAVSPQGRGWVLAEPEQIPGLRRWAQAAPPVLEGAAAGPVMPRVGLSRGAHAAAVERILDWIGAGDLYQANLTFQVSVPWTASPQALARRLSAATPGAAHAALVVVDDDTAVVSASPETFLRVDGRRVVTRPIKGTRPRAADAAADAAAGASLQRSVKDHAEHVMIVDLERNDLGRVCEPGTVEVTEYAGLELLPTVWHLTSTVQGRLRRDVSLHSLLAATFPPGSVTGTPKRMAVARTRQIEPVRRGVYCGTVGIVTAGLVDFSVAIRTAVISGGTASYGTGGAIVADSDPDDEYAEAMAKAAAFVTATGAGSG